MVGKKVSCYGWRSPAGFVCWKKLQQNPINNSKIRSYVMLWKQTCRVVTRAWTNSWDCACIRCWSRHSAGTGQNDHRPGSKTSCPRRQRQPGKNGLALPFFKETIVKNHPYFQVR
jgi:hypothetical protein